MKRFTKRDKYDDVNIIGVNSAKLYEELDYDEDLTLTLALYKLAELEDIEEELGIDLIILLKALMNGIYVTDDGYIGYDIISSLGYWKKGWGFKTYYRELELSFSDYGKIWALTKEELGVLK